MGPIEAHLKTSTKTLLLNLKIIEPVISSFCHSTGKAGIYIYLSQRACLAGRYVFIFPLKYVDKTNVQQLF